MPQVVSNSAERAGSNTGPEVAHTVVSAPATISTPELDRSAAQKEQQIENQRSQEDLLGKAQEIYKSLEEGVFGLGTDEARLFKALEGLTPTQVLQLKAIYKEHYNLDLDSHLESDLSADELQRAQSLLKGDKIAAAADALALAMNGAGTDEEAIRATLAAYPGDLGVLARVYEQRHGQKLNAAFAEELSGDALLEMQALLQGRQSTAAAARIHAALDGAGTDEEVVRSTLSKMNTAELQSLKNEYQRLYGENLDKALAGDYSGSEAQEVVALSSGNLLAAANARLQAAVQDGDRAAIEAEFLGKPAAERLALLREYSKNSANGLDGLTQILADIRPTVSESDYLKIQQVLSTGALRLEDRLHDCVEGLGTGSNIQDLLHELGNLSTEEARIVQQRYAQAYGESLKDALEGDLSGRAMSDALLHIDGLPSDPTLRELALARRHLAMVRAERADISTSNLILDSLTDKDERLDKTARELNALLEHHERFGRLSPNQMTELRRMNSWARSDLNDMRAVRDSAAETAATVASTAAAAGAMVATAGLATPLVIAAAAAAGGAGYVAGKASVQGSSYEFDGMGVDLISGAADGALNVVGAGVAGRLVGAGARAGMSRVIAVAAESTIDSGLGGAAGGVVQASFQKETWQDGVVAGVERVGEAALVQGAAGMITGAGINVISQAGGRMLTGVRNASDAVPQMREPAGSLEMGASPLGHTFVNPGVSSSTNVAQELPMLDPGRSIVIGRSGEYPIDNPHISRAHAELRRDSDGTYYLRDGSSGRSSMAGTYLVSPSGVRDRLQTNDWVRVEPGQLLDLGGEVNLRVPPHRIAVEPGRAIEIGRGSLVDVPVPANSANVSSVHATLWSSADGRVYIQDGGIGGRASRNGTFIIFPDGRRVSVGESVMEVPPGCEISLGAGYRVQAIPFPLETQPFQNMPGAAGRASGPLTQPVRMQNSYEVRVDQVQGEAGRTIQAAERRVGDGYIRGQNGEPDRYLGRSVIGHGTPINGGVYIGVSRREAIVVDFNEPVLERSYQEFLARMEKISGGSPQKFKASVLDELHDFVDARMGGRGPGIMQRVDALLKEHELTGDQKVHLGFFIDRQAGVCRHRALMAASFLERMVAEGRLSGSVEVRRNGIGGVGAHAWAVYQNSGQERIVIDPMQGYVGRADDVRAPWDYREAPSAFKAPGLETSMALGRNQSWRNDPALQAYYESLNALDPSLRLHTTPEGHRFVDWGNVNGLAESPELLARARSQIGTALEDMMNNRGQLRNVRHNSELVDGVSFIRLNNGRGNTRVILAVDPRGVPHVVGSYTHGDGRGNDYNMFAEIVEGALQNNAFRSAFNLPVRV